MQNIFGKWILIFFILFGAFSVLLSVKNVNAACTCAQGCPASDCCTDPPCTSDCNNSVDPPVCAWSDGNNCTEWCDNGNCVDGWLNQICCDGIHNRDMQVIACDNCGDGSCNYGEDCSSCEQDCGACCTNSNPDKPTLDSIANGIEVKRNQVVSFNWNAIGNWGTNCSGNSNRYELCVSSNQTTCDLADYISAGTALTTNWTAPNIGDPLVTWAIRANNGAGTNQSDSRSFCLEGFVSTSNTYVHDWSAWGQCDVSHVRSRTRTCSETCGIDDCDAYMPTAPACPGGNCTYNAGTNTLTQTENCTGEIRGTIFDASDIEACPGFDPVTGYLNTVLPEYLASNREFGLSDTTAGGTHPWSPLSPIPMTTDGNGNYTASVYAAPSNAGDYNSYTTYTYDFSPLRDKYFTNDGPKLTCNTPAAYVTGSPTTCLTQPCTVLKNMTFGFFRIYGGWWQVKGGTVYANTGIKSQIPSSLQPIEKKLILSSDEGRTGFLAYGIDRPIDMLGSNPNAQVSDNLWEIESKYEGLNFDFDFYQTRFHSYDKIEWIPGDPISDPSTEYEIYTVGDEDTSIDVNNFNFTLPPGSTRKVIFLINGNVTVTGNISVPAGAFLAVISKGNITFDPSVASADGWYVANNINVPCELAAGVCAKTDIQFQGNGSFIGYQGINLGRDQEVLNNTQPAELFIYRPDLYDNAPEQMRIYSRTYDDYTP